MPYIVRAKRELKHFHNPLSIIHTPRELRSKGQSSIYVILIIMVIIFAVMFAGGGGSLFSGSEPTSVTDAPSPTEDPNASPTATQTSSPGWSIDTSLTDCQTGKSPFKTLNITVKGTNNGYVTLEEESTPGNWTLDSALPFVSPSNNYTANLPNDSGYNTKAWRLKAYLGGSNSSGGYTGGVEKVSKTGSPTGC